MKATGIIRKTDELGRVVIPMELRRLFDIQPGDGMEVFVDGADIILRKYAVRCTLCGEGHDLIDFKGNKICPNCAEELKEVTIR